MVKTPSDASSGEVKPISRKTQRRTRLRADQGSTTTNFMLPLPHSTWMGKVEEWLASCSAGPRRLERSKDRVGLWERGLGNRNSSITKAWRDAEKGSLHFQKGKVDENSPVESPKCSVTARVRHCDIIRRKERVESPLVLGKHWETLGEWKGGRKEEERPLG